MTRQPYRTLLAYAPAPMIVPIFVSGAILAIALGLMFVVSNKMAEELINPAPHSAVVACAGADRINNRTSWPTSIALYEPQANAEQDQLINCINHHKHHAAFINNDGFLVVAVTSLDWSTLNHPGPVLYTFAPTQTPLPPLPDPPVD